MSCVIFEETILDWVILAQIGSYFQHWALFKGSDQSYQSPRSVHDRRNDQPSVQGLLNTSFPLPLAARPVPQLATAYGISSLYIGSIPREIGRASCRERV